MLQRTLVRIILLLACFESQAQQYTIMKLGTLGGLYVPDGGGISTNGNITGTSDLPTEDPHAYLDSDGALQDLGTLGGTYFAGLSVNSNAEVTGFSDIGGGSIHAFLYSNGTMHDLGTFGGTYSEGDGINESGQVTGSAELPGTLNTVTHAFLYSKGIMKDLGTLGGSSSAGFGINASGQVTGYAALAGDQVGHAFLYSSGDMKDLGTLGGSQSWGYSINASGQVTGYSYLSGDTSSHAYIYSNGTMGDLGSLGDSGFSLGRSINASGQVTGLSSFDSSGNAHAFLYSKGHMTDLNGEIGASAAALYTLQQGRSINDKGQILVEGIVNATSEYAAFVLTPTTLSKTTTDLTASAKSVAAGTPVSLTAMVTQATGASIPTGTVAFKNGTASIGSQALNATGQATLTTSALPVGSNSVTAEYSGDATHSGSTSNVVMITVNKQTLPTPILKLSTTSLAFGKETVKKTSTSKSVTATNRGTGVLKISSITLGGAQPHDFALSNTCGASLAAGKSCTISITFTPVSPGAKSAFIKIADNASGSPQSVSLSGTGVAAVSAPVVKLSATSLAFGSEPVNMSSASKSVNVTNTGTGVLTISSILIGGQADDFALSTTCTETLAAGASCTLSVRFKPVAPGAKSASVSIADNATGSPQSVALSGTGTAATGASLTVSPTSLSFASTAVGAASATKNVTLTNRSAPAA